MESSNKEKIRELVERVRLTSEELGDIVGSCEKWWEIPAKTAEAQLNKVLNDPDLALKAYTTRECINEDAIITKEETIYIPLCEAIKEAQDD